MTTRRESYMQRYGITEDDVRQAASHELPIVSFNRKRSWLRFEVWTGIFVRGVRIGPLVATWRMR